MSQNQGMPSFSAPQEPSPYGLDATPPHMDATPPHMDAQPPYMDATPYAQVPPQPAYGGPPFDPEAQRRAAAEHALANPTTPKAALDIIAATYPDLIPAIATHPALKPPSSQKLFIIAWPVMLVGSFFSAILDASGSRNSGGAVFFALLALGGLITFVVATVRLAGNVDATAEAVNRMAFRNQ